MRLSESLRRNILISESGSIINKFKVKKRRTTLFFEDILANYIKMCEDAGHADEIKKIGEKWCVLGTCVLTPNVLKKMPSSVFFKVMKLVWTNIGILEDLSFEQKDRIVTLRMKNNTITRSIGKNKFMVGCMTGVLKSFFVRDILCVHAVQDKASGEEYFFELGSKRKPFLEYKEKEKYDWLNDIKKPVGHTLKDAIRKKTFCVQGNRIFFREKSICNSENTLFHLFGNEKIMLDCLPKISYKYFLETVSKKAETEKKLLLLKNLLQVMGWGIFTILKRNKEIIVCITNPPYGLQTEKDNWDFLIRVILGYLWLVDKKFSLKSVQQNAHNLEIKYSLS